jgi:hypothetical protein
MQLSGFFRIIQPVSSFDKKAEMEVRSVLNALEDAYQERNLAKLDHALHLLMKANRLKRSALEPIKEMDWNGLLGMSGCAKSLRGIGNIGEMLKWTFIVHR